MKHPLALTVLLLKSAFTFPGGILSESAASTDIAFPFQNEYPPSVSFGSFTGSSAVHLYFSPETGDTLWTCPLESTDIDFYNPPLAVSLSDGGFAVSCPPDCFSDSAPVQRISQDGEILWTNLICTEFILGSCDFVEICPKISTIKELRNGNIVIAGRVAPYLGSSDAWFVACLNGRTGESQWSTSGYEMGQAAVNDIIETDSGLLLAVGATSENSTPETGPESVLIWGESHPLVLLLRASGEHLESFVPQLELTDAVLKVSVMEEQRFLLTGSASGTNELTRIVLQLHK